MSEETRPNQSHTYSIEYEAHKSIVIVSMTGAKDFTGDHFSSYQRKSNSQNCAREERRGVLSSASSAAGA